MGARRNPVLRLGRPGRAAARLYRIFSHLGPTFEWDHFLLPSVTINTGLRVSERPAK